MSCDHDETCLEDLEPGGVVASSKRHSAASAVTAPTFDTAQTTVESGGAVSATSSTSISAAVASAASATIVEFTSFDCSNKDDVDARSVAMDSFTTAASSLSLVEFCKICHCGGDAAAPLIAPCVCSGSLKYVHQECLQRWIKSADISQCELCKYPFAMESKVAVAVKTLKTGSSVDEKLDFLSEADMMKRFDHKNIVKLLGVCTRNEPVYTVMEFMLYGDLKTYLLARRHLVNERNREELDEVSNRRLTSMALDVARGLSYLADLKYVHRDVACRNCLVNSSRVVKLADFGMTRPMYENDYYRFSKRGMLPVRWMAPESLSDGLFTPLSDAWSFGVLLYEMITFGSFPFQGLSNNQVLEHVKSGNTLAVPVGIKSQLETLLRSCWHMAPTKRPTAAEVVELLSNNPRLISPCIDVPLASVQVERTDSLELIPSMRKASRYGRYGNTNGNASNSGSREDAGLDPAAVAAANSRGGGSTGSGPYSPMNGVPNGMLSSPPSLMRNCTDVSLKKGGGDVREPLLGGGLSNDEYCDSATLDASCDLTLSSDGGLCLGKPPASIANNYSGSSGVATTYVPPGYIILDHREAAGVKSPVATDFDLNDYVPTSVASV